MIDHRCGCHNQPPCNHLRVPEMWWECKDCGTKLLTPSIGKGQVSDGVEIFNSVLKAFKIQQRKGELEWIVDTASQKLIRLARRRFIIPKGDLWAAAEANGSEPNIILVLMPLHHSPCPPRAWPAPFHTERTRGRGSGTTRGMRACVLE
ncbi:hypothetical protein, unlikely [Trypanosoma brucei gambiense DAL972]|uniref:Uncharacterized protein n=1 Tax=Trypanosoma brucei gambiense (strain MHOM/CI/86/DAL972) TaxID=679716 RepID=C9ZJQ3_TRYB9|nr:hypothetical protein, unlikely [Trypanosoma brucei gambiense DAL972]CBH09613.1 hypothetical protein, unlikely [Trypanosoma brucei gambiense DAL972]|eukprot:XP_011771917.1 hypothetical protein, unlikely [Trypanosoma brucei gambiense DAL972]